MRPSISRATVLALATAIGLALSLPLAACSGPHSGKSEKLKKPRKKERPKDEPVAEEAGAAPADTKCRVNFFAEPTKKRKAKAARSMAAQSDRILVEAESETDADRKVGLIVEAIEKLSNALRKDPYGPLPTFKLAVAYALANKQGCAIALLERLAVLQKHPDVEKEAGRVVKQALKDPAFDGFRKDATAALGE